MHRFGHLVRKRPSDFIANLTDKYARFLAWSLNHRWKMAGIMGLVFVSMFLPFTKVEKSAFSGTRVESVRIEYEFSENVNYVAAERFVDAVEKYVEAHAKEFHLKSLYSYYSDNTAFTALYPFPDDTDDDNVKEIREKLRKGLPKLPGVKLKLGGFDEEAEAALSTSTSSETRALRWWSGRRAARRLAYIPSSRT
jgi:HAE1 family hydrophobic/amphiphilic exporter-1